MPVFSSENEFKLQLNILLFFSPAWILVRSMEAMTFISPTRPTPGTTLSSNA